MSDDIAITPEQEELLSVELPKWPAMIVVGESVTTDQALEIIRRTDTFFTHGYDGNDKAWTKRVRETVGCPVEPKEIKNWAEYTDKRVEWINAWGAIETGYVHNNWISSAFVYGPHGWCHPDGTILHVDNVGKWPEAEDIYRDWVLLARTFPFLKLNVVLHSGETCEDNIVPLIGFRILNGEVEIVRDDLENLPNQYITPMEFGRKYGELRNDSVFILRMQKGREAERGIPMDVIQKWADEHKP